jgi:hypothetical protein
MLTQKRFVTLAVTAAAALVPALGAQAAQASIPRDARIAPAELCHPKWVLPPTTDSVFDHGQSDRPSVNDLDVENQTSDGSDPLGPETVEYDDLTYDGC